MSSVMAPSPFNSIFKAGSRTYYYSSLFFSPDIRDEVSTLYSFVRVADNYVDSIPQNRDEFFAFRARYEQAAAGIPVGDEVIAAFVRLADKRHFDTSWITAFLNAMEQDLSPTHYHSIQDTIAYMYGSAEVVGLMMARILELPEESFLQARLLGRSMQYINFIRDIAEDLQLGRVYLPQDELRLSGLSSLSEVSALAKPEAFTEFLKRQIDRYLAWQKEAEGGFKFLPIRARIPIATASDMYKWTALAIYKDPFIVFKRKVKPSVSRILLHGSKNVCRSQVGLV